MTKDEALKLALETLESSRVFVMSREKIKQPEGADWYDNRIIAIKEALAEQEQPEHCKYPECECPTETPCLRGLAQPEREPVAWEQFHEHLVERNFCPRCGKRTADLTTIHTCTSPPREW